MYEPIYHGFKLHEAIHIEQLYTIHYFEYMKDFSFPGEKHNFWEFLCVDKGEIGVIAGRVPRMLTKGQIIFHKPNEFHSVFANGQSAPNLVVVAFSCNSELMSFFQNKILEITDSDRALIASIIQEARSCFSTPLNDPYLLEMKRNENAPCGGEQLIRLYLEELLLSIYRRQHNLNTPICPAKTSMKKSEDHVYEGIIHYMEKHICEHLSLETICQDNLIGRSQLQALFQHRNKCGIIDFFSQMKINEAKIKIREGEMNITQISDYLGYTSIHYFSRQFKKVAGMSPSEYASSIKAYSEFRNQ